MISGNIRCCLTTVACAANITHESQASRGMCLGNISYSTGVSQVSQARKGQERIQGFKDSNIFFSTTTITTTTTTNEYITIA